jgi:hypothetical protein
MSRRQAVLDRIVATRAIVVGSVVAIVCVLAGYIEASAKTRTTNSTGTSVYGNAGQSYGGGSDNYGGGQSATQGLFGGGSPPNSSSGGGSVVSGGS